ncbi:MAG: carbon-nitrogen hydrolase family protein [Acidobacteria bacterium]|nr:carbon-nitrogen hydrolase family protein [Acidobacteriota bacterium]
MHLHLSRFVCTDPASNLARMEAEGAEAAAAGADLCVFPESFLHGYSRRLDPAVARTAFERVSSLHPLCAFLFGSLSEERRNRMTVWKAGREMARYDKVHLFAPNGERDLWEPGDSYATLRLGEWTLGLLNCNDLRFPEQARALRLEGRCDLLLAVAWWPWRRDHILRALLRARAIENACFAAVCALAASEWEEEPFAGAGNHVFDPHGEAVRTLDDRSYFLDRARLAMPVVDPVVDFVPIQRIQRFQA